MKIRFLFFFLFSMAFLKAESQSAVTFYAGGRLGDKLMTYVKAKWFAYKYNLPFLCSEFEFMQEFQLSKKDTILKKGEDKKYKHKKIVKNEKDIDPSAQDTLFIIDFYVKSPDTAHLVDIKQRFQEHPLFFHDIRSSIAPRQEITSIVSNKSCATVAVHVRRGSGGDLPLLQKEVKEVGVQQAASHSQKNPLYSDVGWPTKFPPDSYYLAQIRRLNSLLNNQPLYIYIFTDYAFPEEIVAEYTKALNLANITIDCRSSHNYKSNIIQDLFAMAEFDYLIRSISSFSGTAFLCGNHKKVIAPAHAEWRDDTLVIDRILLSELQSDGSYLRRELENI